MHGPTKVTYIYFLLHFLSTAAHFIISSARLSKMFVFPSVSFFSLPVLHKCDDLIGHGAKFGCRLKIQYTVYCILYTVYSIQNTVYSIQYTVYSILYTVYSIQCTVYSIQYTVYCRLYTVYSIHQTIFQVDKRYVVFCAYHNSERSLQVLTTHRIVVSGMVVTVWGIT